MPVITFRLHISAEEYLRYYQGKAHSVVALGEDGRRIKLPAVKFRPFLDRTGIQGRFRLEFDQDFKFVSLSRISK